jgi:aminopeptidase N
MRNLVIGLFLLFSLAASAQVQFPEINVRHYTFGITLNDNNDTIRGEATVEVKFLKGIKSFRLNLSAPKAQGKGMVVTSVHSGGKPIRFVQDTGAILIKTTALAKSTGHFTINYWGVPADGLIISTNKFGHRTFFGDNWPNRAHNWLPCADYPADKATVDFIVTAPDHYQVVANGLKVEEKELQGHQKLTHWKESAPLATKVMVIGVADFAVDHTGDVGNVPVYTYVFPENKEAGFKSYAVADDILPFYIKKLGPFAYEKLANVQSKTIFGGMENASAIFYFENSVTSKGIEELMAHEIAHQWFGDAVSEKNFADLWLSEGFATYMTNVYLENKYGGDTLQKRLKKDRALVFSFEKRRLTPVVDTAVKSDFMQLLNANSYQKGGWVLHMLRRKLGDSVFWKGIRTYYARYKNSNANTDDFKRVMEQASGQNLDQFFQQWLYSAGHPKLTINWKYDDASKQFHFTITQQQEALFQFPLEVSINGQIHVINVANKETEATISASRNDAVVIDPNVNLLAGFEIEKL